MLSASKIKCHVYLENVEIDFSNIHIIEQIGTPPTAIINVVPIKNIFNILPKTICVITLEEIKSYKDGIPVYEEVVIFFGEYTDNGLNRTATSSEVQLTFTGFTGNWDTNPIVPIDATIPTAAESVMLGINYFTNTGADGKGIYYSKFPSLLLSLVNFMDTTKDDKTIKDYEQVLCSTNSRNKLMAGLKAYWKNNPPEGPDFKFHRGTKLRARIALVINHFLFKYGPFLNGLMQSLLFDSMINYIGSGTMENLAKSTAVLAYLKERIRGIASSGSMPVSSAIRKILEPFKYTFQEFAAPVLTIDALSDIAELTLSKVIVAPECNLLAPISNNVFFDDDVETIQMNRSWRNEPTRLIYTSNTIPTKDESGNIIINAMLAIIVPAKILVSDVINKLSKLTASSRKALREGAVKSEESERWVVDTFDKYIKSFKNQKTIGLASTENEQIKTLSQNKTISNDNAVLNKDVIDILKYTNEEAMRGVVSLVEKDDSALEQAFLLNAVKDSLSTEVESPAAISSDKNFEKIDTDKKLFDRMNMGNGSEALMNYKMQLAETIYVEKRRIGRTAALRVTFSPYRVCGAQSLLLLKDFGPLTGVITTNIINISAQGEAVQNINLSHVSCVDTSLPTESYADFLDPYKDILPPTLSEFNVKEVGGRLYVYLTGRSDSSVYDYCVNNLQLNARGEDIDPLSTSKCAAKLQEKYNVIKDTATLKKFTDDLTYRRLATLKELMSGLSNAVDKLTARSLCDSAGKPYFVGQVDMDSPRPFIRERQNMILNIFKATNPAVAVWKGLE